MRIGFFDSGVGGLTVLNKAIEILPKEDFIYYADTKNIPYGIKPKEEVKKYIFDSVEFLVEKGIKALVVACNTATSVAINELREKYDFPVLGMEPAVKVAVEKNGRKRILVVATPLTLKEDKYQSLVTKVDHNNMVDELGLPRLVEFAEGFIFDEKIISDYLYEALVGYDISSYSTVVLGCTHFPFYKNVFEKVFGSHTNIIDGNSGTVNHLKNVLKEKELLSSDGTGKVEFYSSGTSAEGFTRYLDFLREKNQ